MKLFNICIIIASLGLGACASGGGSSGVAPVVAVAPQTVTPTDQRVAFDSWVDTYSDANAYGDATLLTYIHSFAILWSVIVIGFGGGFIAVAMIYTAGLDLSLIHI